MRRGLLILCLAAAATAALAYAFRVPLVKRVIERVASQRLSAGPLPSLPDGLHVVLCGANANGHYWGQFLAGQFKRRRLVVLSAGSGDKLWAKDANYRHRPIVVGNEIIAEPWAFDLYTGETKTRSHPLTGQQTPWKFARPGHHCGAISATPSMLFYRSYFTAYYDLEADSGTRHFGGHRLGCWINSIPANGLLLVPEASAGDGSVRAAR